MIKYLKHFCDECGDGPLNRQVDHIQISDPFNEAFYGDEDIVDLCYNCYGKIMESTNYYNKKYDTTRTS